MIEKIKTKWASAVELTKKVNEIVEVIKAMAVVLLKEEENGKR